VGIQMHGTDFLAEKQGACAENHAPNNEATVAI
jgi:hypothetical protein